MEDTDDDDEHYLEPTCSSATAITLCHQRDNHNSDGNPDHYHHQCHDDNDGEGEKEEKYYDLWLKVWEGLRAPTSSWQPLGPALNHLGLLVDIGLLTFATQAM